MRTAVIGLAALSAALGSAGCDNTNGQKYPGVGPHAGVPQADGGALVGVGSSGASDGGAPPAAGATAGPTGTLCVWSADCAAGRYCDLGECIADCSDQKPCASPATCSSRGRCVSPGQTDQDPPPVTHKIGVVTGEAVPAILSDRDDSVEIRLSAGTTDKVRYRMLLDAPYLAIDEPRGEFTEDASVRLKVDRSALSASSLQGSVHVLTTLGDVVVNVPMQMGVTGVYHGVLTYGDASAPPKLSFGSSELVLDLTGNAQGDVLASVEPDHSLLFPAVDGAQMSGRGTFDSADGADITMKQVLPADFGGDANPFRRKLGRQIHLRLTLGERGSLDGTFDESIFGLFESPVVLHGTAHFDRKLGVVEPKSVVPPADPGMPTVSAGGEPSVSDVFPGWDSSCLDGCTTEQTLDCAALEDLRYHSPLELALEGALPEKSDPLGDIADTCRKDLALTSPTDTVECAEIPRLACALGAIQTRGIGADADELYGALFAHTVDPALFVAQDDIVTGLKSSFVSGFTSEQQSLLDARAALRAPLRWVLSTPLIERLRRSNTSAPANGGEPSAFFAARTLVRTLYVLSTIDGELGRLAAGAPEDKHDDLVKAAQEKGIITLFEAAVITGLVDSWPSAPPDLATEFSDVVSTLDKGFATLVQGALTFGVPEGFIPMVYEPGRKPTNFEQEMDLIQPDLDQAVADEQAFVAAKRDFEQSGDGLDKALDDVRASYDEQIKKICGDGFDLDKGDMSSCGADKTGDVGLLAVKLDEAHAHLEASESRMSGMKERIQVEWDRLNQVDAVRQGTIEFTQATGEKLSAIDFAEGMLNSVEQATQTAAQSGITNFGLPAAGAVVVGLIEEAKAGLESARQDLQTAQDVRVQEDNARVEVINGMATIKGLMIDMAQLRVEMKQDLLGVLESQVDLQNSLATAKRLLAERTRTLSHIGKNAARDASYRLLEERAAVRAIRSRAVAQKDLYLAGRALEYELNTPFESELGTAALNVFDSQEASTLKNCLGSIYGSARTAVGQANSYSTEFSLRKRLGVDGKIQDPVTGETLDEGQQFRAILLRNENIDGNGGVGIDFSSNLGSDNGLWPTTMCDDRILSVEAELVGDFLGDNQAEVDLVLDGGGVLADCDSGSPVSWSTSGNAAIQAGVNSYGTAPSPNASLYGLSVASAKWKVIVPGPSAAPSNADVDFTKLEDIVLRIRHAARPIRAAKLPLATDCLADVGAGR